MPRLISRRSFCLAGMAALVAPWLAAKAAHSDPAGGQWNVPGPAPHLFAHFMPWFSVRQSADAPAWRHWKGDYGQAHHDPDNRLANGQRDIASVYYPLIGPYSVQSPAVVRYQLETARAAGIQGLFLVWDRQGDLTDIVVPQYLNEAERLGMKIAICTQEKNEFEWRNATTRAQVIQMIESDFRYIEQRYTGHPAYLRRNGIPFVFQFNGSGHGPVGPNYLSPDEYVQVLATLPSPLVIGRQGLNPAYSTTAACRYLWVSINRPKQILSFGSLARKMIDAGQMEFFMHMICPGFNDTGVWGWGGGPRIFERKGLSLLRSTFDHAFDGGPELIQLITWNDFNEGTVIEPTRENGFQYLDAIATWWAQRNGTQPDLDAIRQPFLTYTRTCSADERAELPTDCDPFLVKRPLTVEEPHYLENLAAKS